MSSKSVSIQRPGGRPGAMIGNKAEKLKNPKETMGRLFSYIGSKKISLVLVLLFCIITTLTSILGTKYNGEIVDKYISVGDMNGLYKICIILVMMYVVGAISTFIQNRIMINLAQTTSSKIRKDLFESIQKLPLRYFDTNSSGDLMSRLTNDVDNINMTLSQSITQFI